MNEQVNDCKFIGALLADSVKVYNNDNGSTKAIGRIEVTRSWRDTHGNNKQSIVYVPIVAWNDNAKSISEATSNGDVGVEVVAYFGSRKVRGDNGDQWRNEFTVNRISFFDVSNVTRPSRSGGQGGQGGGYGGRASSAGYSQGGGYRDNQRNQHGQGGGYRNNQGGGNQGGGYQQGGQSAQPRSFQDQNRQPVQQQYRSPVQPQNQQPQSQPQSQHQSTPQDAGSSTHADLDEIMF